MPWAATLTRHRPKACRGCTVRAQLTFAAVTLWMASAVPYARAAEDGKSQYLFNDSHFHLTNYIQQGTDIRDYLQIMGDKVERSTLFGIPLQQTWSYANSGNFAPTYYLQSDAPLYYYSFTDAYMAMTYRSLDAADRARFDPMI